MSSNILEIINNQSYFRELLVSCIECVQALHNHIQILFDQTRVGTHSIAQIKSAYKKKDAFTQCLKQLWRFLIIEVHRFTTLPTPNNENQFDTTESLRTANLLQLLEACVKLREELNLLPKMDEPIELYRFLRIFDREKVTAQEYIDSAKDFVLYAGNERSALAYKNTPFANYEEDTLKPLALKISDDGEGITQDDIQSYHICIPREDTQSPLNWPILAHEVGHHVMRKKHFKDQKIDEDFFNYVRLKNGKPSYPSKFDKMIKTTTNEEEKLNILRSWLTECWCDIFGYLTTGPAFLFAQRRYFLTMLRKDKQGNTHTTHPPHYLRLLVLILFAKRFPENIMSSSTLLSNFTTHPASQLLKKQCDMDMDIVSVSDIHVLAMEIHEYFIEFFRLSEANNPSITDYIQRLIDIAAKLTPETVSALKSRLDQGYPIPSTREQSTSYKEREISVHEIMLAAWLSYEQCVMIEMLEILTGEFESLRQMEIEGQWEFFENTINPIFKRFNQSVLRSLQISEWVALLKTEDKTDCTESEPAIPCEKCTNCYPSLLVDHQIENLIRSDQLKIIPLINLRKQLGSTSLDVRLGTTFQTYQPNQSGVVDFTDQRSVDNISANSSIRDLDFLESIVLAPGQFVLAHTMEYIGLPENVGAQIEGRSSFARLGIQVHMTANLIDPGFHGSVTLEIFNAGPNPIRLFPGYRIGQLRFFECNKPKKPYNKKLDAKYKGLLEHSNSLLSKDYEVECIKKALNKIESYQST